MERRNEKLLLISVLSLGFGLRFYGAWFGLPHLFHADEPIIVNHALAYGTGDFNPHFFKIPPLVSYLLFIFYGAAFLIGKIFGVFHSSLDFEFLFYQDPSLFYWIARLIFGVLAGTLSVYVFYRLIRSFFGVKYALGCAFLMSVCFLHVRDSHYVYADIPLLLVILCAFFSLIRSLDVSAKLSSHFVFGCWMGAAAAVKYNGGPALLLPYLAGTLIFNQTEKIKRITTACVSAAGVFIILNPYALLDFRFFLHEIAVQAESNAGTPWLHHLRYSLWNGLGAALCVGAVAGLVKNIFSWEKSKFVFLAYGIFYYVILCYGGQNYDRYVLPLLPAAIFFAVDFAYWVAQRIRWSSAIVISGILVLYAFQPLAQSILFDRLMSRDDVRTLAREWIEKNILAGAKIALDWDFYMPRLNSDAGQLKEKLESLANTDAFAGSKKRKLEFLIEKASSSQPAYELYFMNDSSDASGRFLLSTPLVPYDLEELKKRGVEFIITVLIDPHKRRKFYEAVSKRAILIREFSPFYDTKQEYSVDKQPLTGGPFLFDDVSTRFRNGYVLRIYKL